jgi:hypothetical protein
METGRSGESDAVREVIGHYNQCRGPNRYPVIVEQGTRQYVRVDIDYAIDPSFREELVKSADRFRAGNQQRQEERER